MAAERPHEWWRSEFGSDLASGGREPEWGGWLLATNHRAEVAPPPTPFCAAAGRGGSRRGPPLPGIAARRRGSGRIGVPSVGRAAGGGATVGRAVSGGAANPRSIPVRVRVFWRGEEEDEPVRI
ncbi:hypothetical protein SETIT_2G197700v2 [Setaria italica]|uniref:Uncharacterized protein n=1 Tax=Setaria italica TaxID=4555 RepID=A0A368Q157_SETIT|nr:hypothetical protein SETIT_2G197700v2 [Setaria italica]